MRISKRQLRKIIEEEKKIVLNEGGCGCGGTAADIRPLPDYEDDYSDMVGDHEDHGHANDSDQFMSRDESLKAVVAIAMSTSCPITRNTLLDAVRELM